MAVKLNELTMGSAGKTNKQTREEQQALARQQRGQQHAQARQEQKEQQTLARQREEETQKWQALPSQVQSSLFSGATNTLREMAAQQEQSGQRQKPEMVRQVTPRGEMLVPASWAENVEGYQSWIEEYNQTLDRAQADSEARDGVWQENFEDYLRRQSNSNYRLQRQAEGYMDFLDSHRDIYGDEMVDDIIAQLDAGRRTLGGISDYLRAEGEFRGMFPDRYAFDAYHLMAAEDVEGLEQLYGKLGEDINGINRVLRERTRTGFSKDPEGTRAYYARLQDQLHQAKKTRYQVQENLDALKNKQEQAELDRKLEELEQDPEAQKRFEEADAGTQDLELLLLRLIDKLDRGGRPEEDPAAVAVIRNRLGISPERSGSLAQYNNDLVSALGNEEVVAGGDRQQDIISELAGMGYDYTRMREREQAKEDAARLLQESSRLESRLASADLDELEQWNAELGAEQDGLKRQMYTYAQNGGYSNESLRPQIDETQEELQRVQQERNRVLNRYYELDNQEALAALEQDPEAQKLFEEADAWAHGLERLDIIHDLADMGYDYDRLSTYQQTQLDAARYAEEQEKLKEQAKEHPVLYTAGSIAATPFQALDAVDMAIRSLTQGSADDIASYEPLNVYNMDATNYVSGITGAVSEQLAEEYPYLEIAGVNVPSFAYQTGTSMVNSALHYTLGPAGLVLMGTEAAAHEMQDIVARGGNNQQVLWGGLAAGVAEVLFEKVSMDRLLKPRTITGWVDLLKNAGIQGVVELSEEGLTEVANILSDAAIMGRDSRSALAAQAYVMDGMSEEKARQQVFYDNIGQVMEAGAGGLVSGVGMGGTHSAVNYALGGGQFNTIEPMQYRDGAQDTESPLAPSEPFSRLSARSALDASHRDAAPPLTRGAEGQLYRGEAVSPRGGGLAAEQARAMVEASEVFGENGQRAFDDAWDGQTDSGLYYAGFSTWYQAGMTGKAKNQVRGPYAGYVNEAQRSAAYDAGQKDAAASLAKEKAAAPQARTAGDEAGLVMDGYVREAIARGEESGEEGTGAFTAQTYDRLDRAAKALGVRVRLVDSIDEGRANSDILDEDIQIEKDNPNPIQALFGHELLHRLQQLAPEQYRAFRAAAEEELAGSAVQMKLDSYRAQGKSISYEGALNDVTADYAGQLLEDGQVLDEFIERHRTDRTLLQKLRDAFRSLWQKLTGAERRKAQTAEGKLAAALDAAAEQAGKLTETGEGQGEEGEVKYSIKKTKDGKKYVEADRFVISGDNPRIWREQLQDFINGEIRQGRNVELLTEDGEVLTLTADTAGKLSSPFTPSGKTMPKDTYYTKVNAGAHIDELAQISEPQGKTRPDVDARHGDFASGGWQYRTAYYMDGDRKYYQLTISVAKGSDGNVVYNIGEIRRRNLPNTTDLTATGSSAKGGAQSVEKTSSDTTVPQSGEESKTQYSLKGATITKTYNQLLKENDALRERVNYWRGQTKTTKAVTTDRKSVAAAAKSLVKEYGVQMDEGELGARLQTLYDAMATGRDGDSETGQAYFWEQAEAIARDIAGAAVEEWSLASEFPGLKEKLRTTPITLGREYDGDIQNENFRKEYRGKLKLSAQGKTNVEAVYAELAEAYPGLFPQDITHPADQLEQIMSVTDSLYDVEQQSRFSGQMEEAVTGITNEIMEGFFDLPQTKTFADRQAEKLALAKAHGQNRVAETREQYQARMQQLREQNRKAVQQAVQRERNVRQRQLQALKDKYKARTEAGRERQKAGELRRKITRHAKSLSDKLLRPTDKAHIPEELRGPVAKVLESINLESTYFIDRKSAHFIQKKDGTQGSLTGKHATGDEARFHNFPTKRTLAFLELKQKYAEINKNGGDLVIDPTLLGSDAEGVQGSLDAVIAMGDTPIAAMNSRQLNTVWQVLKSVEHSVSTAGKLLNQAKYHRTAEWAGALDRDTRTRRDKRALTKNHASLDLENPYTFFSHFGQAGKDLYRTLRNAQDRQQVLLGQVTKAAGQVVDEKTVRKLEKATHDFTTENGQKLTLSTAQIMELFELSKRKQAQEHLLVGGIVQPEIRGTRIRRGTDAIRLTLNDLAEITGTLTEEEVQIADGLQKIAATLLADMGNEASMTAYGYRKFTEPDYWPIRSAREGLHSNIEKGGDNTRSIKNIGMAQATVPHANNQVDIGSIFDTFARHSGDMVDYAAWLCTMEDLNRVYNYQFRDGEGNPTGKTVKGLLNDKGGEGAQKYWHDLMEDIQNGIKPKSDSAFGDLAYKGVGSFKASAVGGNIRVIMQQFTAFFRALAVMNPADMTLGLAKGATKGFGWQKALKYSPIAMRKDAGGFDISSPGTMKETLFGKTGAVNKINDFMGKGAGAADAFTWGKLWNASEWQVARQHKGLQKGSRAFYKEVNRVFTDMVDQTQVVDGVLQRSNIMRSQNAMVQQATSFMGEPVMSLNLTMRAWDQLRYEQDTKKRGKAMKNLARAVTALIVTDAVNALVQSLPDAWRDDDKDKKYAERFWTAFHGQEGDEESDWERALSFVLNGNLGQGLNPANKIPYVKDLMSILQDYDVSRAEFSVIEDIVEAGQSFIKSADGTGPRTMPYALNKLFASAAKMFGLPVSNVERDVWAIFRSIVTETGNLPLQYEMEKAIYNIGSEKNKSRFEDIMYRALEAGEMDTYLHIRDEMMRMTPKVDGTSLDSAMKSRYKSHVEKDKDYTLSQRALDLIGIRTKLDNTKKEDTLGPDDLDSETYQTYAGKRADSWRAMSDNIAGSKLYKQLSNADKDKALDYAWEYAHQTALAEASGGEYKPTSEWVLDAQKAEKQGVQPWEYALYKTAYGTDTAYKALERGNLSEYKALRGKFMDVLDKDGTSVDAAMRSKYEDELEENPRYAALGESALDFIGVHPTGSDDGDSFGADDLERAAYDAYTTQRAETYRETVDGLEDMASFRDLDQETRDKLVDAAYTMAHQTALADNSEGQYEPTATWIAKAEDAQAAVELEPWEYLLWREAYNMAHSDKDANNKAIKGREKKAKVRSWLLEQEDLTPEQRAYLWGTEYKSAW